jgi:hypothetical protein
MPDLSERLKPADPSSMRLFKHNFFIVLVALLFSGTAAAQSVPGPTAGRIVFGVKVSLGARYDAVRAKQADSGGSKKGAFLDTSLFMDIDMTDKLALRINLPVFRPIYFAAAYNIFHFEPEIGLLFRVPTDDYVDVLVGPTLGATLHYGADYVSLKRDAILGAPFFAIGPRIGGYAGLDAVPNPDVWQEWEFQVGISPYYSLLFSVDDAQKHRGFAIGGSAEGFLGFRPIDRTAGAIQ